MNLIPRVTGRLLIMLGLSACGIAGYSGTTNVWTNIAGGTYSDGGNWDIGVVPGASDMARFTSKNIYTVSFTHDETNDKIDVAYGTVTFDMNGFTNHVMGGANGLNICNGIAGDLGPPYVGTLTITNGAIIVDYGASIGSYVSWQGTLIVEKGGKLQTHNTVNIEGQGKLIVTNGGQVEITAWNQLLTLQGVILVDGINTLVTVWTLDASTANWGPQVLRVSGGAQLKTLSIRQFNTGAVYTVDSGTIYLGNGPAWGVPSYTNYFLGTLQGNGTIDFFITGYGHDYTNSMFGTLIPGCTNAIGTLTFTNGTLNLMPSCTVAMEIGGATNYDRIYASNLVFNGTCTVSMAYGYRPMRTERYKLFDWVTQSGAFATLNLPVIHSVTWDTNSIYTTGELIAIFPAGTIVSIY